MTGTDIAVREPQSGTLALSGDQIEWSPVQQAALAHIGIDEAPLADQQVFMHICQRVRLDPFARQIYMIPRQEGTGQTRKTRWTIQTGIDGFRLIAERHPQYRGQVGPQWCGEDGVWVDVWLHPTKPPVAARVGVLRADREGPIWGVAIFREYAQTVTYDGQTRLTKMWREKGAHMIAKCAEALGIRKAFPTEIGGLHTEDELGAAAPAGDTPPAAGRHAVSVAELTGAPVSVEPEPSPPGPEPAAAAPEQEQEGRPAAAEPAPPRRAAVAAQKKRIAILTGEAGLDDAGRYEIAGAMVGRAIASTDQLSNREAAAVIDGLQHLQATDDFPGAAAAYLEAYRAQNAAADPADGSTES